MPIASPVELSLVAFFALSGLALAGLTLYLRAYRLPNRGLRSFTALLALMAGWSFSAAGKLVAPAPVERALVALELPMGVVFALLFLVFAAQYSGRDWHRRRSFSAVVVALLSVLVVGLVTNPVHGLFWSRLARSTQVFPHYVHAGLGPAYYLYVGLAYVAFVTGVYALVSLHLRSRYNTASLVVVVTAGSVPLVINLVSLLDTAPIAGLDYTPLGLAVFGAATAWSMRRDLFDIVPLARDTAVEQSSEGMVILDSDRRVRDFNPTAADLVPGLAAGHGEPLDRLLDGAADIFDADGKTTVTLSPEGEELTHLSVQVSEITDGPHLLGWTVVLSDVTDQRQRERHLQLVSRVLRHNMANRIDTIVGHVELLEADADPAEMDHLRAIDASATTIIETSVKLRTIQEIVTAEDTGSVTDVSRTVEAVVGKHADRYPDATVSADCPDGVSARCPPGLRAVLANLVENGIEHDPDPSPTVSVAVRVDESLVHVRVIDDGPGIPESERRILQAGETPLRHSSGVGLWLVYNFVEQAGHELAFETTPSGGSEVRFSLDRAR